MRGQITLQFPPSQARFLNSDGTISKVWYDFLSGQYRREGGPQDSIFDLISLGLLQSAQLQQINGQFDDVTSQLDELRSRQLVQPPYDDQLDELRSQVDALQQAYGSVLQQLQASDTEAEVQQLEAQVLALTQFGYQATSLNDLSARIDSLTTDQVAEGVNNLYFTQARARGSISVSGSLAYNASTGVISYTTPTNSATASAWATARTFTFTGNVTGSLGPVDGSANVSAALTIGAGQVTQSMLAFSLAAVATSGAYSDLSGRPSLGTAAAQNTGTSGANVPLLNGANTWGAVQTFSVPPALPAYTVASLPAAASNTNGIAIATDLLAPAIGSVVVGGGSVRGAVISDGTNWRAT